jgi:dihydrodipicolinate synthase/N-acetylneuraminate lyase
VTKPMRGIYTIPSTPFDDQGRLDEDGLRRIVDFCVGCGAHGIVSPVNASSFSVLTDDERKTVIRIVVEQTAGRVPVVSGVAGVSAEHAAMFAAYSASVGADAVIAMPPYVNKISYEDGLVAYYRAISDAGKIPIHIQNYVPPVGTDMSVKTLARILKEVEHAEYIKEETLPATHKLTQVLALALREAGPKLKGVFGGSGCRWLLLEYPRGSAGNMPGCHVTDVCVRLWNALEAGDCPEARRVYGLMAPLFAIESQCPGSIYKETLVLRGVIKSSYSRNLPPGNMDAEDQRMLKEILAGLEPLFTWRG